MLDDYTRFKANDEIALLTAISMTEVTTKKAELYQGLATNAEVKNFFERRAALMRKVNDGIRKHLDKMGRT
mgnify:CR=1 FL=1